MYSIARKILFLLDPEVSHELSLDFLNAAERLNILKAFCPELVSDPVEVMGLHFQNRVGLAAGLDKNGDVFNALGQMGFGFVEIGTITPSAQPGNPVPRMFRLKEEQAIINRMGFNNKGVKYLVDNVKRRRYRGVLGINIGKNKTTPEENALNDYVICMEAVYPYADYITINISSPNTPGLRNLQFGESFDELLVGIKAKQISLEQTCGKYVPIAVKIAPDMSEDEIKTIADTLVKYKIDAVIATNTTVDREGIEQSPYKGEEGGLSGAPLMDKSTQTIKILASQLKGKIPIIGVGGIMSGNDASKKIEAGATLVQIYSGLIYRGPELVREVASAIEQYAK